MKITKSEFIKSAVLPSGYPAPEFPDIAFSGKSNVGKSSLINALLNRKAIAKVSSTPGKTRLLNFFKITFKSEDNSQKGRINFVDLPGYGYAKVSKKERNSWRRMLENYFAERIQLRGVIVIVDIRHRADPKDLMMLQMLKQSEIPFLVVAAKADKVKKTKIQSYLKKLRTELQISSREIIPCSSTKKIGLSDLKSWIFAQIL